jgi:hypothetical protein
MLAAPPRAKPGSLATSMARTIAANVSVTFISCPPGCHSRSIVLRFWHDQRCARARKCKSR